LASPLYEFRSQLPDCDVATAYPLLMINKESRGLVNRCVVFGQLVSRCNKVGHFALGEADGFTAVALQEGFLAQALGACLGTRAEKHALLDTLAFLDESAKIKLPRMCFTVRIWPDRELGLFHVENPAIRSLLRQQQILTNLAFSYNMLILMNLPT
jgi:hypothetical protein